MFGVDDVRQVGKLYQAQERPSAAQSAVELASSFSWPSAARDDAQQLWCDSGDRREFSSRRGLRFTHQELASHILSNAELKNLCKVQGCMPEIVIAAVPPSRREVYKRVNYLDSCLRERVQEIGERLCHSGPTGPKTWHEGFGIFDSVIPHLKLGIIEEILPTIIFYILYSLSVTAYAYSQDWEIRWSLTHQDSIYYVALVLAFLLSFRSSDCMMRYQAGCQHTFEMEKSLRELAFEVMTKLDADDSGASDSDTVNKNYCPKSLKMRYFKHEFRRISQLLFACAARDLNDSALGDEELRDEDVERLRCTVTDVEHAAIRLTHSAYGHVFRVYLVAAWLRKMVLEIEQEELFDEANVFRNVEELLRQFKMAWLSARQVAYSSMPVVVTHLLWVLTNAMNLVMPWELVTICQFHTWFPSMLLSISLFGILRIASAMENPFGFDTDDIAVWKVAEHLDEEICLIMYYAGLDEVGCENLYRSMHAQEQIWLHDVDHSNGDGDHHSNGEGAGCR